MKQRRRVSGTSSSEPSTPDAHRRAADFPRDDDAQSQADEQEQQLLSAEQRLLAAVPPAPTMVLFMALSAAAVVLPFVWGLRGGKVASGEQISELLISVLVATLGSAAVLALGAVLVSYHDPQRFAGGGGGVSGVGSSSASLLGHWPTKYVELAVTVVVALLVLLVIGKLCAITRVPLPLFRLLLGPIFNASDG